MFSQDINWARLLNDLKLGDADTGFLDQGDITISFSGGADSMLCLFFFIQYHRHNFRPRNLKIYFLDHDQGHHNEDERSGVISNTLDSLKKVPGLNIDTCFYQRNIQRIMKATSTSFERAASRLRQKHLNQVSKGYLPVLLGHNLSDWYETVILRLNRGTSSRFLAPFDFVEGHQVRPLHLLLRDEVRALCRKFHLVYWDDPSNDKDEAQRNVVRKLLPVLNREGLRRSATNLLKEKNERQENDEKASLLNAIHPREFHINYNQYSALSKQEKSALCRFALKQLGLYPLSASMAYKAAIIPFHRGPYAIERENWGGDVFIGIRRGRTFMQRPPENFINAATVTKSYYIRQSYGKKSLRKIFSELRLSKRQLGRIAMPREGAFEVSSIPLEQFGLKSIKKQI